jgi:signal transduction histidine kinase
MQIDGQSGLECLNLKLHSEERMTAGQLALEVMHEIRNPLEALGHLTYLTLNHAHEPVKVTEYMRMAEEQLATLHQIVNQTLGFARTSAPPQSIDLLDLTEAALRIHHKAIEAKKIHLVKDLPQGVIASVRMGEILQVISNLIVNALDALPSDGILFVRLRRGKHQACVLIADNGHGIAVEDAKHIFEPFFTTKKECGTGIGLALSKKIIERHGGHIAVRSSVRMGRNGTTFKLSLPA